MSPAGECVGGCVFPRSTTCNRLPDGGLLSWADASGLTSGGRSANHAAMIRILLAAVLLSAGSLLAGTTELLHSFKKVQATDQFWAEGAAIGDFNHDGKMDVVSGAYWYEGPDVQEAPRALPG